LTEVLVERLGLDSVSAIDPSPPFVAALRTRFPGLDVRSGTAEQLPFPDDSFDRTLAELVVHFMSDPVAGLREMGRVTRDKGLLSACVWDHSFDGGGPLTTFWQAVRDLDPAAHDESALPGSREGHLAELCESAGLHHVEATSLTVTVQFSTFADWWDPYLLGVGPAGAYVARLDETQRAALRARCAELLPAAPFEVAASAWCVTARP
jgi:SAM-dependent methyltransferase